MTTGISARERARTIRTAVHANSRSEHFARPGHVFPLRARTGGVLERRGHTEAAVDLGQGLGDFRGGLVAALGFLGHHLVQHADQGFGNVGTQDADPREARYQKSILDVVMGDAQRLNATLSGADKRKVDEYLFSIRSLEKRIESAERNSAQVNRPSMAEPASCV